MTVLRDAPERLAARYGLRFQRDIDDLGEFQFAAIELADGSQAWLLKHLDELAPGTPVLGDQFADPDEFCQLLCEALACTEDDILWRSTIDSALIAEAFAIALGVDAPRLSSGFPIDFPRYDVRVSLHVSHEVVTVAPSRETPAWRLSCRGQGQEMIVEVHGHLPAVIEQAAWSVDASAAGALVRGLDRHLRSNPGDLDSKHLRDRIQSAHESYHQQRMEAYRRLYPLSGDGSPEAGGTGVDGQDQTQWGGTSPRQV